MGTVPTPGPNLLLSSSFDGAEKWHDKTGAGWLMLADEVFKAKEACLGYIFPSAVTEESSSCKSSDSLLFKITCNPKSSVLLPSNGHKNCLSQTTLLDELSD